MAERELSILVRAKGALQAARDIGRVDASVSRLGKVGTIAGKGIGSAIGNIAKLGLVAGAGLGAAVKSGINDLAALEDATTTVDGAIKALGLTGQITSRQVATWANDIESDIGAAFDDKAITSAAGTLLRFGSVTPKNLRPAMVVMTDLAAKTGDVDSAASLLAKALADPTKAAGKLARMGIVLTKSQQDQIKALVKAGKTEQAQAVLLDAITEKTKGAAAATQGPYRRALSILADVSEDAKKALAEGFLPILEKVAGFLSKKLADPKVIDDIRTLGKGLADGFDKALSAAAKIPWGTIGDSMKLAGAGAKAALDLFTNLPPWVQTAVITGWGLNKLTGGAVGGIVGELGKGLIKGVLGMNAGVVNINAAVVNGGGGGIPGAVAGAGGAAASAAGGLTVGGAAIAVAVPTILIGGALVSLNSIAEFGKKNNELAAAGLSFDEITAVKFYNSSLASQEVARKHLGYMPTKADFDSGMAKLNKATVDSTVRQVAATERAEALGAGRTTAALAAVRDRVEGNRIAVAAAAGRTAAASTAAGFAARSGGYAAAAAINAKRLSTTVKVNNPVTVIARLSARDTNSVRISQARAYSTISGAATAS